jgi:hypothetical protein
MFRSAGLGGIAPLDESTVAAGLKESLRVGTERTVAVTSQQDGFWGNPLLRIALPDSLAPMASALRAVGLGSNVDELELAMNRAAETASAEAREVFWTAIKKMTLQDAFGILNGGDTAATEYFEARTSDQLRIRFLPIVNTQMQRVGVYRVYEPLLRRYTALPFVTKPAIDLDEYVTGKALDGLFATLGNEEKRIREDPAARSTELLRRVFGGTSQNRG